MMMTRRSERMSRPSRMAPGMQVQSAIALAPACGRVCTRLSCLILHAPRLASASPAARRPFTPTCCAADTAISQPPAGPCANARSTVAPEIRVHVRPGQDQLGHVELLPQLRDPVRSPPRGCHAAGRPRRIGRRIGQRFRRERLGHSVGVVSAGMAHWLRGPKVRALGGVAGRTCAAVRGASVLASSQLPCRVVYFCCSPARRPLETSPHHERNLLCEVETTRPPRRSLGSSAPCALGINARACRDNRALRRSLFQ